jgi:hypothetical protein
MVRRLLPGVLVLAIVVLAGAARAADDPSGTWKFDVKGRNGQSRTVTLKLKLEGDKLTGAIVGRNNMETAVSDGTFKDGAVSFSVVREANGQKMTTKYSGTLSGDEIKGKIETERANGQTNTQDWAAKRDKA